MTAWPYPPDESPSGPLAGVKVLDFSRVLAGPFATMTLGDLGADVVKVEQPGAGDDTRAWGPPYVGDQSAYFLSANRNKRSITVDLGTPEGHAALAPLIQATDVVIENFRPGTADRLGIGYEALAAINPAVLYASISGYGQTGPERDRPGYDAIAQARSGLMSITGTPEGPPVRVGVASADLSAGLWVTIGILAALHERTTSGRGQRIDVALLDAQASLLTYVAAGYFATGERPERYGSAHPTIAPYQGFPTADGDIMIAVGNDRLWQRCAAALELPELIDDPHFATNPERVRHRAELIPLLSERMAQRTTAHWLDVLGAAGIPVGPIQTVDQALADPQLLARGMVLEAEHPTAGPIRLLGCPINLSRTAPTLRRPPPGLGQHTDEVLGP